MNIEEKITQVTDRIVAEFSARPIATTLKGIIALWILREVIKWFKS